MHYSLKGVIGSFISSCWSCSIGAGWFWNKGLERSEASKSGLFLALEPVFGILACCFDIRRETQFSFNN